MFGFTLYIVCIVSSCAIGTKPALGGLPLGIATHGQARVLYLEALAMERYKSKVKFTCPKCGKVLWMKPSDYRKRRYCSSSCANKAQPRMRPGRVIRHEPGETFGKLTVIREGGRTKQGYTWWCECECGTVKEILGGRLRYGLQSCGCLSPIGKRRLREKSPNWKGGRHENKENGYVYNYHPEHPNANNRGYLVEHVQVMSKSLGRPLRKGEGVHHLNGIKNDNRIENLELWHTGHRFGARVSDKIRASIEFLRLYSPESLREVTPEPRDFFDA